MRHAEKKEGMSHTQGGKKQVIETACERDQMSDLTKILKQPLQIYLKN